MRSGTVRWRDPGVPSFEGLARAALTWSPDGRVVSVSICQLPSVRFRRAVLRKLLDPTCPSAACRPTRHFLTLRMSACPNACEAHR